MGWLFNNRVPSNIRSEIERLCTCTDPEQSTRPIKISRHGNVWSVAIEMLRQTGTEAPHGYQTDDSGRFVFGAVFRTRRDYGGWGYRLDEETVGPAVAQAPISLISLLSPTTSTWANNWRRRCIENATRRSRGLSHGDVIRLPEDLEFGDGRKRSLFRVIIEKPPGYDRSRTVFQCIESTVLCRISRFRQRDWVKVSAADGDSVNQSMSCSSMGPKAELSQYHR